MRSHRLQELARLRELAENEKDEQIKACNERRWALRALRKFEKQNMAEVVPLRRSQRLTPQAKIPQNLEVVPLRRSQRLTPQEKIPQNLDCDASRKRKGKAVVHENRIMLLPFFLMVNSLGKKEDLKCKDVSKSCHCVGV
ncbi:hypothetical protein MKX03_018039 [Papaver bracteatum]|nr:hypothetical protein MKX03_018039 [Papaver bracteatum]